MKQVKINEFVTLVCSDETAKKFAEMERKAQADEAIREWLSDPANASDPCYSDIHKDVYGVRPRK